MMKTLKMFGLAATAALGLMAFLGASSASADVLCTTNTTPACAKGWGVSEVVASLAPGATALLESTSGEALVTCSESKVSGTIEKQGEGVEPEGAISSLTWGGCNHTTDTLANGSLKLETRISEPGEVHTNTLTASGTRVTVNIGVSCVYGPGANPISIGDLTVGAPGVIHANVIVGKLEGGFLCPTTTRWTATYTVTNHTGVWISTKQE